MAHVRDLWYRDTPDGRAPSPRHGRGARWLVRYLDPSGVEKAKAFTRRPDADRFAASVTTDVWRGEYVDPRAGRARFADVAADWIDARLTNASTVERQRGIIDRQLVPHFGTVPVADLKPSQVRAWAKRRAAEVALSSLRAEMHVLSAICKAAVEDGLIRRNPCTAVSLPTPVQADVAPWTPAQVLAIIAAHPAHVRPIPWLGAAAGLRQGEAFAVAEDDIDWLRRELRVVRQVKLLGGRKVFAPPKRNSTGTIPLPAGLVDTLAAHLAEHPATPVMLPWVDGHDADTGRTHTARLLVVGRRSAPLRRSDFNTAFWHPALEEAGITSAGKATGFHQLRHYYASMLIDAGESLKVVQARLRHATLEETIRTYAHLVPDTEERTRDAVGAALFRPCSVSATEQDRRTQ